AASVPGCHGTLAATRVCLSAEPTSGLSLSGTIDTNTAACLPTTNPEAASNCVLAGTQVTIGALRVVGQRPLVVVATQTEISVNDNIDVASHAGPTGAGAGAGIGACSPVLAAAGRGGGQGGSLGGQGGNGGNASLA